MSDGNGWSVVHSRRKGKLFTEHQSHNKIPHIHHFHHTHTFDAKEMSVFGSFCFVSDHPIHSFIYVYVSTHIIYSTDRYLDMSDRNGWSVVHSRRKGKLFPEHQRRRQSNLAARQSEDVHKRAHDFLTKVKIKKQHHMTSKAARRRKADDFKRLRERGVHYTKDGKLIHHDGHTWTVKDEIKQYRKDIEEDEKLAERLEAEDSNLVELSFEKSLELDRLQEKHKSMAGDVQKLMHMVAFEREKRKRLTDDVETLQRELNASKGLVVIERERYHRKVEEIKRVENDLKAQFVNDQAQYEQKEQEMDDVIEELEHKLEKAREMRVEIDRLEEDVKIRNHEISRMKESLVMAKEATLHEVVNAAVLASQEETTKLHHIIAHLQKELKVSKSETEKLEAEVHVLGSQLDEAKRSSGTNTTTRVYEKIVDTEETAHEREYLKKRYEELKNQIDTETELAEELENQIRSERQAHDATRKAYDDRLGKDIEALKSYIKDLEAKLAS